MGDKGPYIRIELKRRQVVVAAAAFLVGLAALSLDSETLTMSTSYPSPGGVYQKLVTTNQTTLARDAGTVTVGPGAGNTRLDRSGNIIAASLAASGAVTSGSLAVSGAATSGSLTTGVASVTGSRTYLRGWDGSSNHWLMGGGVTEGVNNALGFNMAGRTINVGPGWTFSGGSVKAQSGVLGIDCGTTNCPGGI